MKKRLFYGFGGLSYSIISQTMSNFFMFFATTVLGISGTLVGIAIAISTIWDGISDTLIGFFSDTKPIGMLGKRNGYMIIATLGMSISNISLWCIPSNISVGLKFVWALVSLLVIETFNTMFSTPFMALGNELAESYNERTKITATSTVFSLIGTIIPSILLVIFLPNTEEYPIGQLNPKGYVNISLVTSSICLLFGLLCSICTIKYQKHKTMQSVQNYCIKDVFSGFISGFKDKKQSIIIWGYIFSCMSTVFLCSVGLHFFTYSFFYSASQITILLVVLMFGTIISQPLWVSISRKIRKKPALIVGLITTILALFGVVAVYIFRIEMYNYSFYVMLLMVFICGVGSGAMYSLPTSIYGDAIVSRSGDQMLATASGTLTFASNIANSITQLLVGVLLDVIKFDSSVQVQTLSVQTGLALILFIGVQSALLISCYIFSRYKENYTKNK